MVSREVEDVISGSLSWLDSKQLPGGSWSSQSHQAAITSYVLMSYLASGNLPNEGEHGKVVARGVQFLLDCVRPDGYIAAPTGESNMYGHGISTIALSEVYGQNHDAQLRPKLERAVKLIISCQNRQGGWRYMPRIADADISVTVLQVVALRAAKNAGLDVPQTTVDAAVGYVKSCCDAASGGFSYQANQRQPGFARTAAAIYSLQVCGLYDDPMVKAGSSYLVGHSNEMQWWTYGNFYAAPAQYMIGGDVWKKWYSTISGQIMARVRRDGKLASWDQIGGGGGGGPVWASAIYTTILSMPYHYIPLYQR